MTLDVRRNANVNYAVVFGGDDGSTTVLKLRVILKLN